MTEKSEKIWQEGNWTQLAKDILEGLSHFPDDSKIIIVLRHSHRKHSGDAEKLSQLALTPLGHEIAYIFGKSLPNNRPIRLYHSIVHRCVETAENILKGFEESGGKGKIIGPLEALYSIGTDPYFIINKAIQHAGKKFLNHWAAGLYPPDKITPLLEYSRASAEDIWNLLKNAPDRGIDIHITHDLSIMGFRLGWFGLSTHDWWVPFLGGFAFSFQENEILLLDKGQFKKIELPYWWK